MQLEAVLVPHYLQWIAADAHCICQLRFFQELSGPVAPEPIDSSPLCRYTPAPLPAMYLIQVFVTNCCPSNLSPCRHLGPEVVLRVLPLDLQQGLSGSGEARTWLLPALRRHVSGTQLRYWAAHLMPLAKEMGQAAGAASQRGNKVCGAAGKDGEGWVCKAVCVWWLCGVGVGVRGKAWGA